MVRRLGAALGEIPAASAGMTREVAGYDERRGRGVAGREVRGSGDVVGVEVDVFFGEVAAPGGGGGLTGG